MNSKDQIKDVNSVAKKSDRVVLINKDEKTLSINLKTAVLILCVIMLSIIGVSAWAITENELSNDNIAQTQIIENDGNNASFSTDGASIEEIVNKLYPSVVSIITTSTVSMNQYYYRDAEGAGTGIIVSENGYILTNKHVIDGAKTVTVVLADGSTYESVDIVGTDPINDIAFLKIPDVDNLTPAELGDSKTLMIGQQVVAIGNALGQYQNSVTSGIVSGTSRSIQVSSNSTGNNTTNLTDMIQTDASINSGNSGGPLVNAKGQVVGINTAVVSNADGIGFAIPIGATKGMLAELLDTGEVKRAYIGVSYLQITSDVAKEYGLPVTKGAYIHSESGDSVMSGGPADKAGLKNGDIITKVNGVEVGEKGSISVLAAEYRAGDKIELTILRDNQERTMVIELGNYPSSV